MTTHLTGRFARAAAAAVASAQPLVAGRVLRATGGAVTVAGLDVAVGDLVAIATPSGDVTAEVVAVSVDDATVMVHGDVDGVRSGAQVLPAPDRDAIPFGGGLLGRVIDAFGRPVDDAGPLTDVIDLTGTTPVPSPLQRRPITDTMQLGVRALDTFVPLGRGQRLGIFAGSGVGKSTLLGMCTRGADADVVVVCLVGERGREVGEFLTETLGEADRGRAVIVTATSDEPAPARYRAAWTATRIAEAFRDQGLDVLLLMDSVTRFAAAHREMATAAGELPVARGYPPSTMAVLPRLLERAGTSAAGSITALYTVLVDGDDLTEPVADAVRSILDGHVVLSRRLADAGHYPPVDVLGSVSRLQNALLDSDQLDVARQARAAIATFEEARDLVEIGAYQHGSNPAVDTAIALHQPLTSFRQQRHDEPAAAPDSWESLAGIVTATTAAAGPAAPDPAADAALFGATT